MSRHVSGQQEKSARRLYSAEPDVTREPVSPRVLAVAAAEDESERRLAPFAAVTGCPEASVGDHSVVPRLRPPYFAPALC
jgi:hypothetical protein